MNDRSMSNKSVIVCYGEILWDMLPKGLFLGGAPLNVACHFASWGNVALMYSAVGKDVLGLEALNRIKRRGVSSRYILVNNHLKTGMVHVDIGDSEEPTYVFDSPMAYDSIRVNRDMLETSSVADAFVYGTLAQRETMNRKGLKRLLKKTRGLKFYDVNLRPPCMNRSLVLELASYADFLKLNLQELAWILDTNLELISLGAAVKAISELTETKRVCVTLGSEGVYYLDGDKTFEVSAPKIDVKNAVGAGDAFLARFIQGVLKKEDTLFQLQASCEYGSHVASIEGALPELCELGILEG